MKVMSKDNDGIGFEENSIKLVKSMFHYKRTLDNKLALIIASCNIES